MYKMDPTTETVNQLWYLDEHIKNYTASLSRRIGIISLPQRENETKLRFLQNIPLHYERVSDSHNLKYEYSGDPLYINHPVKCVGLDQMAKDAFTFIRTLYMKDLSIPWNTICFNIVRDEKGIVFSGSVCLCVQTLNHRFDEMMEQLTALRDSEPRTIQEYLLYKAAPLFDKPK